MKKQINICYLVTLVCIFISTKGNAYGQNQKAEKEAVQNSVSIESSLILDWIALPKREKNTNWVEHVYTINTEQVSRQKEDRINKELHNPDFELWTKLSEPKPILLLSENGETAVVYAKEYMFKKSCGENEKLKFDFSNLPGFEKKIWILAVVTNETLKYSIKKLSPSKRELKALITSGPSDDKITVHFDQNAKEVKILRDKIIYLDTDCD